MKGKKFYIILIGLIVIGIGSVFVYRQQQEERFLSFEGYEITEIEERVAALYNEDKTDLADDFSEEELEELEVTLSDLQEKDLGRQNTNRIETMQSELVDADGMFTLEENIMELFIEDEIIDKETSVNDVEDLEQEVTDYEERTVYYDRNLNRLDEAKQQAEIITTATDFVEGLFAEEDDIREDVTREEEAEALELIDQVKNEEVKEELTGQIEAVNVALTEREELEALAETEALAEEAEEDDEEDELETDEEIEDELESESELEYTEEPEYTAPSNPNENNSSSPNWNNSGNSNSGSSYNPPSNTEDSADNEETGNTNPVVSTYEETETETIPYETVYIDDNTILKDESNQYPVNQDYENGRRTVTYQVTEYQDGTLERQIISDDTEAPVHREIIRGTRKPESEE